jgi:F-type H+-transporting ATPase subunit a
MMRMTARVLAMAGLLSFGVAAVARAAGGGGGHGEGETEVGPFIIHHVSDDSAYEFEIPLNRGHNPTIHFPELRIPFQAGACSGTYANDWDALFSGCFILPVTKQVAMMWLAGLLLIAVFLTASHRDKSKLVPHGALANMLEMLVVFVRDELAIKNIGKEHGPRYVPYLLTAFFFILFMNLLGLFPWMATATANLSITAGLALCTFFLTQYAAIRAAGLKTYLKHLTGGVPAWLWPIMVPVEVLGLFTKPFALTIRLFANMLAGHIVIFFLLGLIFILKSPWLSLVSVPFALGIYFLELFVAFVQAYIFTMLSALFIGMGVAMAHHEHEHEHAHADEHHKPHTEPKAEGAAHAMGH